MLLDILDQMISIFFSDIPDSEVVDNTGEGDVMRNMLPEAGGAGDRRIYKLGEVDF